MMLTMEQREASAQRMEDYWRKWPDTGSRSRDYYRVQVAAEAIDWLRGERTAGAPGNHFYLRDGLINSPRPDPNARFILLDGRTITPPLAGQYEDNPFAGAVDSLLRSALNVDPEWQAE